MWHATLNCEHSSNSNSIENSCCCPRLQPTGAASRARAAAIVPLDCNTFLRLCCLLLLLLGLTLAAPQSSCILCDKEDLRPREPTISNSYEEFTFDHQVSRQEAIAALKKFNDSAYFSTQIACNSRKCSADVIRYCLGSQFINDHCWCELQHREEGLPYVPHICYVGEKVYKPSIGSCYQFEEIKECCCASALAKEWRHISGATWNIPKIALTTTLTMLSLLHWRTSWHRR